MLEVSWHVILLHTSHPITNKYLLWPYKHSTNKTFLKIYVVLTAYLCVFVFSMCPCLCVTCVWVYQSFSPKSVYLWLPSEVACRLSSGQSHRDERCALHQPATARQQTNRTNQEQEVPLLRYNTHCIVNTVFNPQDGLILFLIIHTCTDSYT